MCNCGSRRTALSAQLSAAPTTPPQDQREGRRFAADAPMVGLVSRSLNTFMARGTATGRQYHFLPRAVLRVDARDAVGLLATGRVRRSG